MSADQWFPVVTEHAQALNPDGPTFVMRTGTVAVASPLRVTVSMAATSSPCTRLASYTPVVGDRVVVLVSLGGGPPLCLGKVV